MRLIREIEVRTLYYETHITIEPVFEERLELLKTIGAKYGFRVASLLMKKRPEDTPERSMYDSFMTAHGMDLQEARENIMKCVREVNANGLLVWRYKIEDVILDSRNCDELELLK